MPGPARKRSSRPSASASAPPRPSRRRRSSRPPEAVRVVIAPDSLKGTIGAREAAAALADGWRRERPGDDLACVPLADGGEGTLQVLAAVEPAARWHQAQVTGPDGRQVASRWLEFPGGTGYVELAQASGLPMMPALDPL